MSYLNPKDQMFAKVILASKPSNGGAPIITMHLRYPRIIHSELMTHRVFSRNARSSRAVPVKTMLEEIKTAPFVPWHWGKNQKGMQASEECEESVVLKEFSTSAEHPKDHEGLDIWSRENYFATREEAWLKARDSAVEVAEAYMTAGYHKQVANRLLEPFMFIDVLVTSTQWANFIHLRDHEDAEPHIHDLAILVKEAIAGAQYQTLEPGKWHIPYADDEDTYQLVTNYLLEQKGSLLGVDDIPKLNEIKKRLSVARCARISYAPFDGDGSIERELKRYDDLVGSTPLHASPAEHQATPDTVVYYPGGFVPYMFRNPNLGGNLGAGWVQLRKLLNNENVPG